MSTTPVVHHLNCGTMCPLSARLMNGTGGVLERGRMVCHCLLVETSNGLVLVDTGMGTRDVEKRFDALFNVAGKPRYELAETAIEQVRALGHDPRDVRHIVVTHLDLDHAGGLADFPHATVHVHARELERALRTGRKRSLNDRMRYKPRQFAHGVDWQPYAETGERWFGFEAVRALDGGEAGDDVLLVPLHGHSHGHCGVAVQRDGRWLLHCGDAYFHRNQVGPPHAHVPAGIKFFQNTMVLERTARDYNIERLRELAAEHSRDVTLICAHDPVTFEDLSGQRVP